MEQLIDGTSLLLGDEEDVLAEPAQYALGHGPGDAGATVIHAPLRADYLLAELPAGDGGGQSADMSLGREHLWRIEGCLPTM